MKIDLHTHSRVSDGTDSPTRLVLKAHDAGLDVISLTDHDTFDGLLEAVEAGRRIGLTVLSGIEMSCRAEGMTVHLLGYGCDPWHRPLLEELARIRVGRFGRLRATADRLTALGMPLTVDDIVAAAAAAPSIGRPHVADAMVAKGYVASRRQAFDDWLGDDKPAYVARYACPLEQAIDLVHQAKGVAVLAHPWGRGADRVLTPQYLERLVAEHELDGVEVEHEDHDPKTRDLLFQMGARLGLIRTGASDYHGTGKEGHQLACNTTRDTAYREILRRIKLRGGMLPA